MTVLHLSYLHCISVAAYGVYVLYVLVISTQSPKFGVFKSDMIYFYKLFEILLHSNTFFSKKINILLWSLSQLTFFQRSRVMYIDYIRALQSTFLSFSYKHIQVLKHFDLGLFSILLHVVPGGINESQLMINKPCIKKYWLVLSIKHYHPLYGRCLFYKQYSIRKIFLPMFIQFIVLCYKILNLNLSHAIKI